MGLFDNLVNNHYLNNSGTDEQSANDISLSGAVYSTTKKLGSHSAYFDGVNDIATQGSPATFSSTSDFAMVCWFNASVQPGSNGNIMGVRVNTSSPSDGNQDTGFVMVRFSGTGSQLNYIARNVLGSLQQVTTSGGYENDGWHMVVVGRESDKLRFNIDNGTEDITGNAITGTWWESGDYFKLGALVNNSEQYKGYIDNVVTYNKWPTTSEISELWNGGAGVEIKTTRPTSMMMMGM